MRASSLFRSGFLLLPMLVAAGWAAGCSDDDSAGVGGPSGDAGGDAPVTTTNDAGDGGAVTNPACGTDLSADKLHKYLSCTGLYANYQAKVLSADAMAYKPSTEFWSDGAEKSRWLYLPPGTTIDTSDMNDWKFPVGTKVWKEFKLGGKRIETRLFTKLDDGWANTTYRWTQDETDAERLEGGELIPGIGPDGGTYEVPTTATCNTCHGGRKDFLLGVDAVSLGLPNATGETLAKLAADGKLSAAPAATALAYPAATAAQGGDKAGPAMAWMHINCGPCHNENTNAAATYTQLYMLMHADQLMPVDGGPVTVDQLDAYKLTVCKDGHRNDPTDSTLYKYVRAGNPARSEVSVLSGQRSSPDPDTQQMPPIVTRSVDIAGHQLLDDWIAALPTTLCP